MAKERLIKVCGLRQSENIIAVETLKVDMIGFIFYPASPRFVGTECNLPTKHCARVGVFVDATTAQIKQNIDLFNLDFVQLHASESPAQAREIASYGVKIIKAFSIDNDFDFATTQPYEQICSHFIFDTKCKEYGGSGRRFDWRLLERYRGTTPFLLSGGIGIENIASLREFDHPQLAGYDLNSAFEIEPALKDITKLECFIKSIKYE